MPEAKKRAPIRRVASRKSASVMPVNKVHAPMQQSSVCHACNALPVGSVELTALMLVLVFSLSAVLFTSVYALRNEQAKVAQLQDVVLEMAVE